ncbi:MAG TPA: hypothetical protein VHR66_12225 [Gemmataceae bacterium]|nr:hypothetical protein [Gemmataceae bacterium]
MNRRTLILTLIPLVAVLAIGVPLFLRTPVWVDVTYHDLSAWNVLHGGAHYRDVFETNLPGMVWMHCLVRPVVGWSHEAIRVVDLLVFGSVVLLLARLLGRSGLSINGRIWFATVAFLFYLFETEFIHCQRDGWMLLPAVAATCFRAAFARPLPLTPSPKAGGGTEHTARPRYYALIEGLLWGLAVWIKPHVLVPALLVWLVSLRFQTRRVALFDTLFLFLGGLIAGIAGSIWLVQTGAWSPMWDVLLNWNQEYYHWSWPDFWWKIKLVSAYFAPFSLLHFVAVPLALVAMFRRQPDRAVLAALYIGWQAQATVIQKEFDYAHAPPTLLGLAVLASFRLPVGPVFLAWCVAAGLLNECALGSAWLRDLQKSHPHSTKVILPHHPIVRTDRLALWGRCWSDGSWELKDQLSFYSNIHCVPDWADLQRVADYLATKDLHDRDLICWHDSTHPLYVWLNIRPAIRYPHVITAMKFKSKREQIRRETFESGARYVVSDLVPATYLSAPLDPPPPGPASSLPDGFPSWGKDVYPWNQPVVYRAGRYVVHEIRDPRGAIEFPFPDIFED